MRRGYNHVVSRKLFRTHVRFSTLAGPRADGVTDSYHGPVFGGAGPKRRSGATVQSAGLFVAALLMATACGESTPELTTHQQLEKVAGRSLTEAEVAEQLELADLLCGTDGRVLAEVWIRLDTQQLEFQDWVFGQRCPDRIPTYERMRGELGTTSNTTTTLPPDPDETDEPDETDADLSPSSPASSTPSPFSDSSTTTPSSASTTPTVVYDVFD